MHAEIGALDHNHEKALGRPLRDCTDEQLIAELARRKVDIQHRVTSDLVAKYYHFESVLGYGASGKVYLVYHRVTGEKFACKVIKKDGQMNDAESMNTEIEIMKRVRHENIVTLYELFESAKCMWLILELVDGTGLRGGLTQMAHYTEEVRGGVPFRCNRVAPLVDRHPCPSPPPAPLAPPKGGGALRASDLPRPALFAHTRSRPPRSEGAPLACLEEPSLAM